MEPSEAITEVVILHLKEDISDLEQVISNSELFAIASSQKGFVRHYFGEVDEDRRIIVWIIDWESLEHSKAAAESLESALGQFFEAPHLRIYQTWRTDPTDALEAPVTEIAYFTLRNDQYTAENKTMIEREMDVPSMEGIKTVGKSPGGAIGWVSQTINFNPLPGHSMALTGVFGYPAVEYHRKWRTSPEHAQVMADFANSEALATVDMRPAEIPGGGIFVPEEKGMIHVAFCKET